VFLTLPLTGQTDSPTSILRIGGGNVAMLVRMHKIIEHLKSACNQI